MEIFHETKNFPREEQYSLIDQIRRSSRSIPANLAEAWKKRRYERLFIRKMNDCAGEAAEVEVWLDIARDCGYIKPDRHIYYYEKYEEVSRMLSSMARQPEKFCY